MLFAGQEGMTASLTPIAPSLATAGGNFRLHEYHLQLAGRHWSVLHSGAVLTQRDEQHFLNELRQHLPYGVALWPSSIALAHELLARESELRGRRVLELGAGTGLPGIVAASLGADVTQTDRQEVALSICRRNGERNGVRQVRYRTADWNSWDDGVRYDVIMGADILYAEGTHDRLAEIFTENLTPNGRVLVADPFRPVSVRFLERLEADGWGVTFTKWSVGGQFGARPMGVFELTPG